MVQLHPLLPRHPAFRTTGRQEDTSIPRHSRRFILRDREVSVTIGVEAHTGEDS